MTDIEIAIMEHMKNRGGGWVTAKEVACEIGYPWQAVASVMVRLGRSFLLDMRDDEIITTRHRVKKRQAYRLAFFCGGELPSWLMPRASAVPPGIGRVVKFGE